MKQLAKKLSIAVETVRALSRPALEAVAGGVPTTSSFAKCDTRRNCPTFAAC